MMAMGRAMIEDTKLVQHSRRLHDPSIRLSFIPKVWDQAFLAAWRNHLNSKEMPLLGDDVKGYL